MTMNLPHVLGSARIPAAHVLGSARAPAAPTQHAGKVLTRGDYLIEMAFARPLTNGVQTLADAMGTLGWGRVVPDASLRNEDVGEPEDWGGGDGGAFSIFQEPPELFRFFGRLDQPIVLTDGPEVSWIYEQKSAIDVFRDLSEDEPFAPFELKPGRLYEIRFIARMKAHPTRKVVSEALRAMHFEVDKLTLLKRDMRLPGHPGTSATLWYGRARWMGPENYVSFEDSFFFQDVEPVEENSP